MLFEDTYISIAGPAEGQLREKGSRFIGLAYPVKSEQEVKAILQQVKKDHPQANHHCYAFRMSPDPTVFRYSDDREPSGSAGRPILNAILSAGLSDILIVVVRYFGGTLLGVPGLINAYRETASEVIKISIKTEVVIRDRYCIHCPYPLLNEAYLLLRICGAEITQQENSETSAIHFEIRRSQSLEFEKKFRQNHLLNESARLENL